jgi:hypothetical protein
MTTKAKAKDEVDPRVTKRRVTAQSAVMGQDGNVYTLTRVDYVPDDDRNVLDAYLANLRETWQVVEVSEEYDAGPGGYHGQTVIPEELVHPLAGTVYEATPEKDRD